ncbi:MAG: tetraacyldisaccharide 4'-kinase [Candidatus Alcyoniella australis]|nr:tetraacyldisaccharide 4'-kinase [Candidatus Alcyoniella australis]
MNQEPTPALPPVWLKPGPLVPIARVAAACYGAAIGLRNAAYDHGLLPTHRVQARTVCVGNISVGGAGKTPTVIALARRLHSDGAKVGIVSRGYGGSGSRRGALVCAGNGPLVDAQVAGDEPRLIAQSVPEVPLYVAADRCLAAEHLVRHFGCEIVLMDDGFSHRRLQRDLDLLLIDAVNGFGNSRLLPAGPLREPLTQLKRAKAIVLSKGPADDDLLQWVHRLAGQTPVFQSRLSTVGLRRLEDGSPVDLDEIRGQKVLSFCGLADSGGFDNTVQGLGVQVIARRDFGDHHRYLVRDYEELAALATPDGLTYTLTTAKDAVRLSSQGLRQKGIPMTLVVDVQMEFDDLEGLIALIKG